MTQPIAAQPHRTFEYRLSWETVSPIFAASIEAQCGRECWPVLDWSGFEWRRVLKITTDPWSQWNTLGRWADMREQPIRGVRLECREVPAPDEGWELVP